MRTSKKDDSRKNPFIKLKQKSSKEDNIIKQIEQKIIKITPSIVSKNFQINEEEFWKDCVELNTIQSR